MSTETKSKYFDISRYYPFIFTLIFVIILFQYSFSTLEAIFYDFRVRYDFGVGPEDHIVLITMDDESDEFLGEKYPYTYASHYRMIKKLIMDKPKIINYFGALMEPETNLDVDNLEKFKKELDIFIDNGGSFRFGTEMDSWGEIKPPKDLLKYGYSLALLNIDNAAFAKDDISRRVILNISGESSLHLWTANQYRKSLGQDPLDINNILGAYYVREADANFALYRYFTSPIEGKGKIQKIPFHRVVVGNYPKDFFKDKIVLIGSNYIANSSDFVLTPFNKEDYRAGKLSVHAEMIESLIQNKTVLAVPRSISYALAIVIAIFLSIIINRVNPTDGLFITVTLMFGIFLLSYIIFSVMGLWIYITHLVLTVFVVYYIWVPFRAIDEYQRRYAIQEETKLLTQVENLKQNFISLMSHDLKTPVAKIAGLADVLMKQAKNIPEIHFGLQAIIDSTKELNKFITSILDLTKIESRNLALNKISKDVNKIIDSILESLKYEASQKNIVFATELGPLYPIELDQNLMMRVISNLVENAIKYSGEGTRVQIKTWDNEEWVYIEISDNGVGIPKEDLKHIFDKFYRVKNDASHSIKGTGLGLYLVKYFVELQGGTISARSELGLGTTFEIKLKNA